MGWDSVRVPDNLRRQETPKDQRPLLESTAYVPSKDQ